MAYAQAEQVTLAWDANTESSLRGYRVYYGEATHNYTSNVDAGSQTTFTVGDLQQGKTYYFAVQAYGDDSGTPIQSDFSNEVSKTIGTPPDGGGATCPCSIWSNDIKPDVGVNPDTAAVELGVKFKTDKDGFITGIRYYKDETNTGTHIGSLWSSSGTRLAKATFANETASGWQQVQFSTPVAIKANTVYVASYHTNKGHYFASDYAFSGKGVDSPPLHVLADGESGSNGVYTYGTRSRFPNSTYQSRNYWVDVIFTTQ
jgi:hypothetical protein